MNLKLLSDIIYKHTRRASTHIYFVDLAQYKYSNPVTY